MKYILANETQTFTGFGTNRKLLFFVVSDIPICSLLPIMVELGGLSIRRHNTAQQINA